MKRSSLLLVLAIALNVLAEGYYSIPLSSSSYSIPVQTATIDGSMLAGKLDLSEITAEQELALLYSNNKVDSAILYIATDSQGTAYITDVDNVRVASITTGGEFTSSPYVTIPPEAVRPSSSDNGVTSPADKPLTYTTPSPFKVSLEAKGVLTDANSVNYYVDAKITSFRAINTSTTQTLTLYLIDTSNNIKNLNDVTLKSMAFTSNTKLYLNNGTILFNQTGGTQVTVAVTGGNNYYCKFDRVTLKDKDNKIWYLAVNATSSKGEALKCDKASLAITLAASNITISYSGFTGVKLNSQIDITPDSPLKVKDNVFTKEVQLKFAAKSGTNEIVNVDGSGTLNVPYSKLELLGGHYAVTCKADVGMNIYSGLDVLVTCKNPLLKLNGFDIGNLEEVNVDFAPNTGGSNVILSLNGLHIVVAPTSEDLILTTGKKSIYASKPTSGSGSVKVFAESATEQTVPPTQVTVHQTQAVLTTTLYNHLYQTVTATTLTGTATNTNTLVNTGSGIPAPALLTLVGALLLGRRRQKK